MKNFFIKQNRGFTIVETLVALSIFTMSILTIMSILAEGISDTGYAKEKISAAYLAQEGIEYVRNLRDTTMLFNASGPAAGWAAFLAKIGPCDATTDSSKTCYFGDLTTADFNNPNQPMAGIPVTACISTCPPLKYDSAIAKYNYTTGVNSDFIRRIKTIQVAPSKVEVFSTVSWTQGSGVYSMVFSEILLLWVE